MPEIIKQLQDDHHNIARLLGVLQEQTTHLEAGEYTDLQLIADIMHYFVNYPDIQHHPREDLIFASIREKEPGVTELIDELYREHQTIADDSMRIYEEIKQLQGNAIFSREKIVTDLKNYISTYYLHLEKEEGSLFSLAMNVLTEDDWKMIDKQMQFVDDPLFGRILSDQYASIYKVILSGVSS
jgi:hemerythrin-like domain-containing protein